MALLLCIETATDICSVCIAEDGNVISLDEEIKSKSHASVLTVLIDSALKKSSVDLVSIDAIAVSKGPGSYTGLRIGVSAAKGICYALDKPLIAVNSLLSMTNHFIKTNAEKIANKKAFFVPMIDARRMEVYTSVFDAELNFVRETQAEILTPDSFSDIMDVAEVFFFGDGAKKFEQILAPKPACLFKTDFIPSASGMVEPGFKAFFSKDFVDIALFEPYYLKDFIGKKPV